jgi:hypothetical protein
MHHATRAKYIGPVTAGHALASFTGQRRIGQRRIGQRRIGQRRIGQQMTGQQMTGQQMTGQQMTGQQMTGQQMTGQQMTGQQMTGQQMTGQQMTGQQMTGQQMTGQQMTGPRIKKAPRLSGAMGQAMGQLNNTSKAVLLDPSFRGPCTPAIVLYFFYVSISHVTPWARCGTICNYEPTCKGILCFTGSLLISL